jgi:uncharacterized protein
LYQDLHFASIFVYNLKYESEVAMFFEDKLIFFPERYPVGDWEPHVDSSLVLQDVWFKSGSYQLNGWYIHPLVRQGNQVILSCHGNAGNITSRFKKAQLMALSGVSVLLFDYRGYGKSDQATLCEEAIYEDTLSALGFLHDKDFTHSQIILHGVSLGGGPATFLAEKYNDFAGIFLESTFTSMPDMCREVYPYLPAFLVHTQFDNLSRIAQVKVPLLLIHGKNDELVPYKMGVKLFESSTSVDKTFVPIEGAGHGDVMEISIEYYQKVTSQFFDKCFKKTIRG